MEVDDSILGLINVRWTYTMGWAIHHGFSLCNCFLPFSLSLHRVYSAYRMKGRGFDINHSLTRAPRNGRLV